MKKLFLIILVLVVTLRLDAQDLDFSQYYSGYYIDNSGNKVSGLIRYRRGYNARIEFRPKWEDKTRKIFPKECREFVLRDSIRFIRITGSFTVKCGIGMISVIKDFVRVLDTGKVNLYIHYSSSGNGNLEEPGVVDWENPVVKKNDSYIGLHPNLKKRRNELEGKLKGESELIETLCREKLGDIRNGLKEYNSR